MYLSKLNSCYLKFTYWHALGNKMNRRLTLCTTYTETRRTHRETLQTSIDQTEVWHPGAGVEDLVWQLL